MFRKQLIEQLLSCTKTVTKKVQTPTIFNGIQHRLLSVINASIVDDGKCVAVKVDDSERLLKFPNIWLRDNCQCDSCFHVQAKSRTINWDRCNAANVENVSPSNEKDSITIVWSDQHKSIYDLNWLKERDFSEENRIKYVEEVYKPTPKLWSKEDFAKICKTFNYSEVLENDKVLLNWLESLAVQGVAIIKNAPSDIEVVRHLAARIGFIKTTTYGDVFEVKAKPNAQNYAYLMTPLPLHTDMPYYEYKAGINILHCLVQSQSKGGASTMTDGFYVADQLRQNYPDYFKTLCSTPVNWADVGNDGGAPFHNLWRSPVICLDIDSRYNRINQNITQRDSRFTVPLEQVIPWYEAYDKFLSLANEGVVEFKTSEGDVITFNNLRILHGRTAYEDSTNNQRHMVGAYVDWDISYSKLRVLKLQHN